jgi:RNA polymerase sigma factor for flagellar operon FliA
MTPEQVFLAELQRIEAIVAFVCRRHRCSREDAEDFSSAAKLKLIEDDYAVFRQFEGKSRLGTYLAVVIERYFLDYRNHLWGKWRPCAEAIRLGETAIRLDELLSKHGHTFAEACEIIRSNPGEPVSIEELSRLAARMPRRVPRRIEREDALLQLPSREASPDQRLRDGELLARRSEVWSALQRALSTLPAEERLIVKMRIEDEFSIANIARALRLAPKPLYPRIKKILNDLKINLLREGIRPEEIPDILGLAERER